jgi:uncharacterized protein YutE (UPF0331/DUF86 family)
LEEFLLYELNEERIISQKKVLEDCIVLLNKVQAPKSDVEWFAVMRALHIGVECVIDIGNTLIDGFIMRDPGGYADIIDILEDEQVVPLNLANQLKEFIILRDKLVRYYDHIQIQEVQHYLTETNVFSQFLSYVEAFLQQERLVGNIN